MSLGARFTRAIAGLMTAVVLTAAPVSSLAFVDCGGCCQKGSRQRHDGNAPVPSCCRHKLMATRPAATKTGGCCAKRRQATDHGTTNVASDCNCRHGADALPVLPADVQESKTGIQKLLVAVRESPAIAVCLSLSFPAAEAPSEIALRPNERSAQILFCNWRP